MTTKSNIWFPVLLTVTILLISLSTPPAVVHIVGVKYGGFFLLPIPVVLAAYNMDDWFHNFACSILDFGFLDLDDYDHYDEILRVKMYGLFHL